MSHSTPKTTASNPFKSPSYPQRVHARERPRWAGVLKTWEDRISEAKLKFDRIAPGPKRAPYERLYFQMLGARDQIADAAARLPMEVDSMYEEDKHKLEEGVAALERLFLKWDSGWV